MTTAFPAILDDALRLGGLGIKTTVTTTTGAGTATTTSPRIARYAQQPDRFYMNYLWIPGAAAAQDQVRTITSHAHSAGTTTFSFDETANFGENLSSETAYILPLHPDLFFEAINEGLEKTAVRVEVPLMHGPASGDMQGGSVDADWTESNATDDVQTDASEVLRGAQSIVVTDNGSGGGYSESADQRTGQGKAISVFFEAKADTGTGELQVIDGSGNVQADIVFTEEQWIAGRERITFDNVDELFTLRLVATAASDSIDWQRVWYVRHGEYSFELPSWVDNDFVVKGLFRRRYLTRSSDGSDQLYLANSEDDELLYEDHHYKAYKRPADVNPRRLTLQPVAHSYMSDPLILLIDCPWSAPYGVSATYTSYTSTTLIPKQLGVALMWKYLGQNQKGEGWERVLEKGEELFARAYVMNELEEQTKPGPQVWLGPLGGRML